MEEKVYKWNRFWYPLDKEIKLNDYGFLSDPEAEWGRILSQDAVNLANLRDTNCLILLGEPGIGKSFTLESEYKNHRDKIKRDEDIPIFRNLTGDSSEEWLVKKLLTENKKFNQWRCSNKKLYLYLDSLDESSIQNQSIVKMLVEELEQEAVGRLFLRITCRYSEWENYLKEDLSKLWGSKDNITELRLAPLRRKDVEEAAKQNAIDPEKFLKEVFDKQVVPFARPNTLNLLLRLFRTNNSLPPTQSEIYYQGCRLLCSETNPRRKNHKQNLPSSDLMLRISGRIAATMLFSKNTVIWHDYSWGEISEQEISISHLIGGEESANEEIYKLNEQLIRATLSTALFMDYDTQRIGWVHQTYLEFLTAWYLNQKNISSKNLLNLLYHSDGRLIPYFYEIAGWLSSMNQDVFNKMSGLQSSDYLVL